MLDVFEKSASLVSLMEEQVKELIAKDMFKNDPTLVIELYDKVNKNHVALLDGARKIYVATRQTIPSLPQAIEEVITSVEELSHPESSTASNSKFSALGNVPSNDIP